MMSDREFFVGLKSQLFSLSLAGGGVGLLCHLKWQF